MKANNNLNARLKKISAELRKKKSGVAKLSIKTGDVQTSWGPAMRR
ncbi:MAG: hypothetical protein ACPG52_00515 [Cognaticolwellia sp.]